MQAFYFAGFRLLTDDRIAEKAARHLVDFTGSAPYTHTFTLCAGDVSEFAARYEAAVGSPAVCGTERFSVHKMPDGWALVFPENGGYAQTVLLSTRDYGEMTVYFAETQYYNEYRQTNLFRSFPFSTCVRLACESGMGLRNGIPLHASLVEYAGRGIVFLGRSGIGKSTQAKLWQKYKKSDFISGDRPCMRLLDGVWYGCGMPWDGKDGLHRQKQVRVCALVALEQADHNEIRRLAAEEAFAVLLQQTVMPLWDRNASDALLPLMNRLSADIPFYHFKNLADEAGVNMTLAAVTGE